MTTEPHTDHVRLYFQNCRIPVQDHGRVTLYKDLQTLHADVIGLAETCLNSSFQTTKLQVIDDLHRLYPSIHTTFSAATEQRKGRYQRGGTLQILTSKLANRLVSQGSDPMGRYCWQRLYLTNIQRITIITAYRVCQTTSHAAGQTSAYYQQWRALAAQGITHPNPRRSFMESISTLLTQMQAEGDEILLQLDANTAPTEQEWVTFLSTHNLVDLHGIISSDPFPNSYASGTEKIDYMLGTPLCAAAVRRGGIRNFTKGPHSDHRGMYLDLDSATLFSEKCVDPTRPAARQLRLGNKRTMNTYLQILQAQLQHHNVFDRIDKLSEQAATLLEHTVTRKYNAIDDDITAACKFAEQLCSRPNYGFPFSAKLAKCGSNIVQLKRQIRFINRGQKTLFHIIPSQIRRNNLDKSATLNYCYSQLRILQFELKEIQEDSIRHREEFLTQLARDSQDNADTIETIKEREKLKRSYRTLKRFVKQNVPTGLDKLEVYDYDTTGNIIGTKILTCPASISTALIEQQYKQFGQAQHTPCVNGPIGAILPPFDLPADTTNSILDGNFDLMSQIDEPMQAVHDFFAHLQRPHASDGSEIDTTFSVDDFTQGFKKVHERISSSASGRHMGHYKAALHNKQLSQMYATMINLPMRHQFVPKRWCTTIQVLIEKDKGRPKIDRLRTIQLVEADFNMVLKVIFGRRLVHHADDKGFLPKSQFGSRPGVSCISAVVLKTISLDLLRQLRQDACIFNNDAMGCYDRIIPSIGMLSCMRLGLPRAPAITLLKILHSMKYHIRTALGLTEDSFSNAVDWILGTLQGSGASPAIWLAISSVLLAALEQKSPGITFRSPDGSVADSRAADAFVDDTDLYISVDIPFPDLAQRAQTAAQHWEQLLYTSGGALNLTKCFWYGVTWEWINGFPRMQPNSQAPATIQLTNGHNTTLHTIIRKECWEGMRTLGVRLAPLGNFEDEHAYRILQFRGLAQNILSSPISRFDAYLGYVTMIQPILRYPLGATSFTPTQCATLDASFIGPILSKMGLSSKTPRAIIYGPTDQGGGLGHGNTETMQGQEHLTLILSHLRQQDQLGQVMRISLDTLNLFLGLPKYPLTYDFDQIKKYHEPLWLTNTWAFLSSIDGSVLFTTDRTLKTQCVNDHFLMEQFLTIKGIGAKELQRLNQCRLYLQVTLLSEISSANGKTILENYFQGNKHPNRRSNLTWPRQDRPPPLAWSAWKKRLQQLFCTTSRDHRLRESLQQWTPIGPQYQQWSDHLDTSTTTLYRHDWSTNTIRRHLALTAMGLYNPHGDVVTTIPPTASPAQVHTTPHALRITAHRKRSPAPQSPATHTSLQARLHNLPQNEQQLVGSHIQMPICETTFIKDLRAGKVHCGTDGSVRPTSASHSWVLQSSRTGDFMAAHARTHPVGQKLSTKRPEAAGHAAALIVVRELLKGQAPSPRTLCIYVDNMAVVKGTSNNTYKSNSRHTLTPEWDLLHLISTLKKSLPIRTTTRWVKGHQDNPTGNNRVPIESLPLSAQLNCHADHLAGTQHTCRQCTGGTTFYPPTEAQVYIKLTGHTITANLAPIIGSTCKRAQLKELILKQTKWDARMYEWVDWAAVGRALRQVPRHLRSTISKLQFNLFATAVHMHTIGNTKIDKRCFRCRNLREDFDHILWCPHGSLARPPLWDKVINTLAKLQTAPYLQHKLLYGISRWQHNGQDSAWPTSIPPYADTVGRLTHIAYFEQEQLGWEQALRGRLSKQWGQAQDAYYKERFPDQHNTGDTWTTKLIGALWEYTKAIWIERNYAYHGANDEETRQKTTDDLNDLVVRSHRFDRHHAAFHHTSLFNTPLDNILSNTNDFKRSWLRSVDSALTGYRLRVPGDTSPRTTQQIWQGTSQTTRHRRICDETV